MRSMKSSLIKASEMRDGGYPAIEDPNEALICDWAAAGMDDSYFDSLKALAERRIMESQLQPEDFAATDSDLGLKLCNVVDPNEALVSQQAKPASQERVNRVTKAPLGRRPDRLRPPWRPSTNTNIIPARAPPLPKRRDKRDVAIKRTSPKNEAQSSTKPECGLVEEASIVTDPTSTPQSEGSELSEPTEEEDAYSVKSSTRHAQERYCPQWLTNAASLAQRDPKPQDLRPLVFDPPNRAQNIYSAALATRSSVVQATSPARSIPAWDGSSEGLTKCLECFMPVSDIEVKSLDALNRIKINMKHKKDEFQKTVRGRRRRPFLGNFEEIQEHDRMVPLINTGGLPPLERTAIRFMHDVMLNSFADIRERYDIHLDTFYGECRAWIVEASIVSYEDGSCSESDSERTIFSTDLLPTVQEDSIKRIHKLLSRKEAEGCISNVRIDICEHHRHQMFVTFSLGYGEAASERLDVHIIVNLVDD